MSFKYYQAVTTACTHNIKIGRECSILTNANSVPTFQNIQLAIFSANLSH